MIRFVLACLTAGAAWIVVEVGGGLLFLAAGVRLWRYEIVPILFEITSPVVWLFAATLIIPLCVVFDRRVTDHLSPGNRLPARLAFLMVAGTVLEVVINETMFIEGVGRPLYTYLVLPTFGGSGSWLSPLYYATLIIHVPITDRLLRHSPAAARASTTTASAAAVGAATPH